MKTWLMAGCLALFSAMLQAQEKPKSSPGEIEVLAPEASKNSTVSTNALSTLTPKKEPVIKQGGLLIDIKRTPPKSRWKMFSLRTPRDPKNDGANLARDLRVEGGGGVKLFTLDF